MALGENQFIKSGDAILSILPKDKAAVVGRMQVPSTNSGKIIPGQKVLIKLDNFRYQEFGIVEGEIQNISLTPYEKGNYDVLLFFQKALKLHITNSFFLIKNSREMQKL